MKKVILLLVLCLFACSASDKNADIVNKTSPIPKIEDVRLPNADGIMVFYDDLITIDYSNSDEGYFMVKTNTSDHKRLKLSVSKDDMTYNYDINKDNEYEVFSFNLSDGSYTIKILENISDNKYSIKNSLGIDVLLNDELLPYLYPNQICNYDISTYSVIKSFEICDGLTTQFDRAKTVYEYVIDNIDYDWDKFEEVDGKYVIPNNDVTYELKKGICFDYSSLMCSMLRSEDIACKIMTGYVEEGYHSWVEIYIDNIGWINPRVYFESNKWTLLDPTFDAMDNKYDGEYQIKYEY